MAHWLLIRRSLNLPEEHAYYRAYGLEATSLPELIAEAGQRWQIEVTFEAAKGEVGVDQYEVRLWQAWYRHITFALLAHAALVVARSRTAASKMGLSWLQRPRDPTPAQPAQAGVDQAGISPPLVEVAQAASIASRLSTHPAAYPPAHHRSLGQLLARAPTSTRLHCWAAAPDAGSLGAECPLVASATASHGTPGEPLSPDPGRDFSGSWDLDLLRQMPREFGPWQTIYYRFQRWKREGLWEQIRRILLS